MGSEGEYEWPCSSSGRLVYVGNMSWRYGDGKGKKGEVDLTSMFDKISEVERFQVRGSRPLQTQPHACLVCVRNVQGLRGALPLSQVFRDHVNGFSLGYGRIAFKTCLGAMNACKKLDKGLLGTRSLVVGLFDTVEDLLDEVAGYREYDCAIARKMHTTSHIDGYR